MSSNTYLPNGDNDRVTWMNNFNAKLPGYATALAITPAELTSVANDTTMFAYIVNLSNIYKQTAQNVVAFKNLLKHEVASAGPLGAIPGLPPIGTAPTAVPAGVFDRISKLAARIKNSSNYTSSIGQDLNIIAPTITINTATMQPTLKTNLDAGRPHIKWLKNNSDALDLYVDREDGAGFIYLGRFINPEYIDVFNLPSTAPLAQWDYKGIYVIGNSPVGLYSPVDSILVKKI